MEKKLSGQKVFSAFLVSLWITIICIAIAYLKITIYWPAFAILNMLTIIGFTKNNIVKVFTSSISGILFALLNCVLGYMFTSAMGGNSMGYMISLFIIMFIILALDKVLPYVCNVYAFIVFTFCNVDMTSFYKNWVPTLLVAIIGGGIAVAGIMLIFKMMTKSAEKKFAASAASGK